MILAFPLFEVLLLNILCLTMLFLMREGFKLFSYKKIRKKKKDFKGTNILPQNLRRSRLHHPRCFSFLRQLSPTPPK
jgi:hypothetical protein